MPFDISAARQAGKTDIQIALYLGQELGFDVDAAMKAGKSPTEIAEYLSTNERPKTAVIQPVQEAPAAPESPPGLGSRVMEKAGQAWQAATNPEYSMSRKALRTAGALGEAAGDVMMTGAGSAYKAVVPQSVQQGISGAGGWLANTDIGKSIGQTFGDVGRAWGGVRGAAPETAKDVEAALQVANLVPAVAGAKVLAPAAKEGVLVAADAAKMGANALARKDIGPIVNKAIEKAIRPSVVGKRTAPQIASYKERAANAVKSIVDNKDNLILTDAEGNITKGKLPTSIKQFSEAIDQTKKDIFRQYDDLARQAGENGAKVTLKSVSDELDKIAGNRVTKTVSPGISDYAAARSEAFKNVGAFTTEEAQEAVTQLNKSLEAFYKNPSYENATKAGIDSLIANNLRKSLDDAIESITGGGYQELKKVYGSLKSIEKEVAHRAVVDARKNIKGLIDFTDIFTAGELASGLMTMNPAMIARGGFARAVKELYKRTNDPNRIVQKMFSDVEKATARQQAFQPWSQTGKAITEVTRGDMNEALGVLKPAETPAAVRLVEPPTRPKGTEKAPEAKPTAAASKQPDVMVISGMPFRNADVAMQKMQQYGVNPAEYGPMEIAPGQWVVAKGGKIPETKVAATQQVTEAPKQVEQPAARPKSPPGPKAEGPENLITLIQQKGGIKFGPTYQGDKLREFPDLKRVSNQKTGLDPDVLAEDLNAEGIASPTGKPWDADSLIETLKTSKARNVFTPGKAEDIIYRKLKGPENEWIEQQLANLNEKVGPESISQSAGDLKASLHNEIRAEGFDIPNEEAAIREIEAFFSEVINTPIQPTVKNAGGKTAPKGGGGSLIEPELLQELSARLKGGLK